MSNFSREKLKAVQLYLIWNMIFMVFSQKNLSFMIHLIEIGLSLYKFKTVGLWNLRLSRAAYWIQRRWINLSPNLNWCLCTPPLASWLFGKRAGAGLGAPFIHFVLQGRKPIYKNLDNFFKRPVQPFTRFYSYSYTNIYLYIPNYFINEDLCEINGTPF